MTQAFPTPDARHAVAQAKAMTFGSLFAGIGGFDLGLERAGLECSWQVEINDFCRRVLAKHWPHVERYADVRSFPPETANGRGFRVDVICGGFPCQDISLAGKGAGIEGNRSGLWREYARIVRILRPRWVLVENVAALLVRGISVVAGDLAACGYDLEWDCLPAAAFGAPHLRDRIFLVAYPQGVRFRTGRTRGTAGVGSRTENAADLASDLRPVGVQRFFEKKIHRLAGFSWCKNVRGIADLRERPDLPQPLIRGNCDGVPDWLDRIAAIGNAVVPDCAEYLGRRLLELEAVWVA